MNFFLCVYSKTFDIGSSRNPSPHQLVRFESGFTTTFSFSEISEIYKKREREKKSRYGDQKYKIIKKLCSFQASQRKSGVSKIAH